jgi:hypothetical protein
VIIRTKLILAALKFRGLINIQDNGTESYQKSQLSNTANLTPVSQKTHGSYMNIQHQCHLQGWGSMNREGKKALNKKSPVLKHLIMLRDVCKLKRSSISTTLCF